MPLCPVCSRKKARRFCPARREDICATCCGTKRLVEINCPSDCPYLQSAERHPAAAVKRQQEHDFSALAATIDHLSEGQLQLFLLVQSLIARFTPTGFAPLVDADVADAAASLAATYETASRGVLYEHQATSTVAESLRRELRTLLAEVGKDGGSRFEREAAEVLRAIERGARHEAPTLAVSGGEKAYLELLGRLLPERFSSTVEGQPAGSHQRSGLIVP
jgi:hypothetical protein